MYSTQGDARSPRAMGSRLAWPSLTLGLLAAPLVGCGGAGDSLTPDPLTPPPTSAAAQALTVLPPLSLAIDGETGLQALASGRTVTWSSNDAVWNFTALRQ